jgi:hypothetical protein
MQLWSVRLDKHLQTQHGIDAVSDSGRFSECCLHFRSCEEALGERAPILVKIELSFPLQTFGAECVGR